MTRRMQSPSTLLTDRSQQVEMMNFGYRLVLTFHYQDPPAADSDTNQMVLQPMSKIKEEERELGVFFEDEYNYLQHLNDHS